MSGDRAVVLVTGSAGFIGRRLVERLAEQYTPVGFDHEGHGLHPPPFAECVCIDLTQPDKLATAMARVRYAYGVRIASVVHLAAYYDFSGRPSPLYDQVTVQGTKNLLEALEGFDVEQVVFSSTMLVHRPAQGPGRPIDEESPLEPKWAYPESKLAVEQILREQEHVDSCSLRMAGVYDDRCHSIPLAHQMQRIYEDDPRAHLFPGDLQLGQAYVHVDDVVEALFAAIEHRHDLRGWSPFLIGEEDTMSYGELQKCFSEHLDRSGWQTREVPKTVAKIGASIQDAVPMRETFIKPFMVDIADDHYELDTRRARHWLGWSPKRSLRDSIPKMAAALREDPERFYRENDLGAPPHNAVPGQPAGRGSA